MSADIVQYNITGTCNSKITPFTGVLNIVTVVAN